MPKDYHPTTIHALVNPGVDQRYDALCANRQHVGVDVEGFVYKIRKAPSMYGSRIVGVLGDQEDEVDFDMNLSSLEDVVEQLRRAKEDIDAVRVKGRAHRTGDEQKTVIHVDYISLETHICANNT